MNALVLGLGLQGKAVVHDLENSPLINRIFAADVHIDTARAYVAQQNFLKTQAVAMDVTADPSLARTIADLGADVIICMLPIELAYGAARAAIGAGIAFVSSNYTYRLQELDGLAKEKNCIVLPEMGLDPGIDLILGRLAIEGLDEVHGLYSYGGGVPAPECADDNPLHYKISWIFERVLAVYTRQARMIKAGRPHIVPGDALFAPENVHQIEFSGLGPLEAYANGDALHYVKLFGLPDTLQDMGRFALRWPGHAAFWRNMVALGLLDDRQIEFGHGAISPRQFLTRWLTPRLQYGPDQRDLALLRVQAWGLRRGKPTRVTYDLIDYRDLSTGLFAMNRTVGFTASIAAQMILDGRITGAGVLSPACHVPAQVMLDEIQARGMHIDHRIDTPA